ncbi:unnamed protein product [Lathyrus oleraceus]
MAVVAVGQAFLSAFIEVVIDRLASPEVVDLISGKKIDVNLVQRLKNTLYAVEAVLNDAEQKQIHDSAVNKWLHDLKDALYVADDILDHISTKAALSKNNNKTSKRLTPMLMLIMHGISIDHGFGLYNQNKVMLC